MRFPWRRYVVMEREEVSSEPARRNLDRIEAAYADLNRALVKVRAVVNELRARA